MTERDRAEELANRLSKSLKDRRSSVGGNGISGGGADSDDLDSSGGGVKASPLVGADEDGSTVQVELENGDGEVCVCVCV